QTDADRPEAEGLILSEYTLKRPEVFDQTYQDKPDHKNSSELTELFRCRRPAEFHEGHLEKSIDKRGRGAATQSTGDDDADQQQHGDNDRRHPVRFILTDKE